MIFQLLLGSSLTGCSEPITEYVDIFEDIIREGEAAGTGGTAGEKETELSQALAPIQIENDDINIDVSITNAYGSGVFLNGKVEIDYSGIIDERITPSTQSNISPIHSASINSQTIDPVNIKAVLSEKVVDTVNNTILTISIKDIYTGSFYYDSLTIVMQSSDSSKFERFDFLELSDVEKDSEGELVLSKINGDIKNSTNLVDNTVVSYAKQADGSFKEITPCPNTAYTPIDTVEGLRNMQIEKDHCLVGDIDLSNITDFNPIGYTYYDTNNTSNPHIFERDFDGNGKTISGLKIDTTSTNYINDSHIGLFMHIGVGGSVRNLTIVDPEVKSDKEYLGVLAGQNDGTIDNVKIESSTTTIVTATANIAGGLVGENNGTIEDSYASGEVNGEEHGKTGGLAGDDYGNIENSYFDVIGTGQGKGIGDGNNSQRAQGIRSTEITEGGEEQFKTGGGWDFDTIWKAVGDGQWC